MTHESQGGGGLAAAYPFPFEDACDLPKRHARRSGEVVVVPRHRRVRVATSRPRLFVSESAPRWIRKMLGVSMDGPCPCRVCAFLDARGAPREQLENGAIVHRVTAAEFEEAARLSADPFGLRGR